MMRQQGLWFGIWMACCMALAGCEDGNGGGSTGADKEVTVAATAYESWTYFNFETGESWTEPIGKVTGGVAGIYKGDLALSAGGQPMGGVKGVDVLVNRVSGTHVDITFKEMELVMMGKPMGTVTLTARAKATEDKAGGKWLIEGEATENLADSNGQPTLFTLKVDGEIGATLGSTVTLTCQMTPGGMPIPLTGIYTAKNEVRVIEGIGMDGREGKYVPGETYEVDPAKEAAREWDIAFHKYDVRTNGGRVARLEVTDLDAAFAPEEDAFTADAPGVVIANMKEMFEDADGDGLMDGKVGFMCTPLNKVLGSYLTVTEHPGQMPPFTYGLNRNVFIVKDAGGKMWKVQFSQYTYGGKAVHAKFAYELLK